MSIEAMRDVWQNSRQQGTALVVMLAIADAVDENRVSWLSVESISKRARKSVRMTQYILRKLVAEGELELIENGTGGRGRTAHYRVQCTAPFTLLNGAASCTLSTEETVQPVAPFEAERVQSSAERVQSSVLKGATHCTRSQRSQEDPKEEGDAPRRATDRAATPAELYDALRRLCELPEEPSARAGYALQDAASKLEAKGRTVADLEAIARWFATEHWRGKTPTPAQLVDLWPQYESWRDARRPKAAPAGPSETAKARAAEITRQPGLGPILPSGIRAGAPVVRANGKNGGHRK